MNSSPHHQELNTPSAATQPKGPIIAASLGAMVAIIGIGVFHLIAEANEGFKNFLTFYKRIGALSGKVALAYGVGFIVFVIAYPFLKNRKEVNLTVLFILLFIALLLGSLFTFTPFVKWVVD